MQIQTKITYNSASKFSYSISGLGDAYLIATKTWGNKNKGKDAISFGIKFPLNNSDNKSNNAISLPLAYQTTLGTTDFILGYSTQVKTWSFAFAAQIPIANNNTNSFISPLTEPLKNFISTKELTRNSDILIRATKVFETSKTINIRLGGLAIYHLGNDSYKDISGAKIEIKESTGLTFNINAGFNFKLNNKLSFDLLIASPVVVRKARPDGLTRSFVIVPELKWNL